MGEDQKDAAVFADISILPEPYDILFSDNAIAKLKKFGMTINRHENQFLQFINKSILLKCLKHHIDCNLMRAVYALNLKPGQLKNTIMSGIYDGVVKTTCEEISKHYITEKTGEILVNEKYCNPDLEEDRWAPYDASQHGYSPFGKVYLRDLRSFVNMPEDGKGIVRWKMLQFNSSSSLEIYNDHGMIKADKGGGSHTDTFEETLKPHDGSDEFKCTYYKDLDLAPQNKATLKRE